MVLKSSNNKNVIFRFYNVANLGDDLFLKIVSDRYRDNFLITPRVFMGPREAFIKNPRPQNVKTFINPLAYLPKLIWDRLRGRKYSLNERVKANADLFLYAGGSIFIEGDSLVYWEKEREFYKGLDLPYFILGSNFGPAKTLKFTEVVTEIISGAKDVCFRDMDSFNRFNNVDSVRCATDMVFSLNIDELKAVNVEKRVVISVIDADRKFNTELAKKYLSEIVSLVERLVGEGYKVTLMSFCRFEGDEKAVKTIWKSLNPSVKSSVKKHFYRGDIDGSLKEMAKSEIVIGTRFHAVILGLLLGKKVVPISYSAKTRNILADLRFKDPIVDIESMDSEGLLDINFDSLKLHDVSEQVSLSELQFLKLDEILDKK